MYTFIPNKLFGQLLDISLKKNLFLENFDSECSYSEVWFSDQISNLLHIEENINITLVMK